MDDREIIKKAFSNALIGQDTALKEPILKVLLEFLREDKPLMKSELSIVEIGPYVRVDTFTDIFALDSYRSCINSFLKAKTVKNRENKKEIIEIIKGERNKKTGFLNKLFGKSKSDKGGGEE